ncbi:hypothetical protein TanjilG_22624 [Lupinus angustifolius]|uniref:Uncharacterized protein n=1 Tax=Lupinus angustifolius TaxID=3871 RepID=A0A4P1RT48_LUPAN|nr:hypothetical protein TanjilG_22624 [Lupinus angustifolius]
MLSWIRSELAEMEIITPTRESGLTEQLLPKNHSHFVHESRSGVKNTNFLLRGAVSRSFSINFLTYGFPISLLALSFWSFHFASLCSFGLLAYVGYVLFAFPSMFRLQQLNGMLLVFILLWSASTYIFNVAFTVSNNKSRKDMEIWETIGLWHYPIPGYYLLAQFGLGFLVAMCNVVNSSVLLLITDQGQLRTDESLVEERKMISFLNVIRWNFLSVYQSCGKYIAFVTILFSVYLCTPNYASFGYIFFLLLWISGRQIAGQTRKHLWYPMKVYAVMVFVSIYSIGVFSSSKMWLSRIIDIQTAFGYDPEASMLQNIWESLAVLVVMQLYSYERRQSKSSGSNDYDAPEEGACSFIRRLLVRHTEKLLSLALFYASLSPISACGFLYLLGLINFSRLPKSSQTPAKVFLVYSGLLVMVEYLFQILGDQAGMFPGQEHSQLSLFMGLQLYKPGFRGLESGLRGKVVVIVACMLQYNVFHWLEQMPHFNGNGGKWNEHCPLFDLVEVPNETTTCTLGSKQLENSTSSIVKRATRSYSCPILNSASSQGPDSVVERDSTKKPRHFHFWDSSKESFKWNRKRILFLRKERLEMQKTVLKVSLKFWIENMFNLFGLEINMIALLLASFALLNAISLLYIASLAVCILLHRLVIKKLWPVFVFLFASIITVEYLAIWMRLTFMNQQIKEQVPCHDCWRVSDTYFSYCKKCWLGIIVDDPRMLISYYGVFMLSCFKFRADQSSLTGLEMYQKVLSQWKSASVLSDLSFETKGYWTFLDHLRLYGYCHLLDFVLSLILIIGTLEYDILHLGYLGFALVFFRKRLKILKQGNIIFRFLRMYNFVLIVLSLAYQSPFVGDFSEIKYGSIECINELVGFHKYDYGFRITSRSAFVEIIIFMLVSLQSYMFSFQEFDYVSKYLEKEQIGAILRQQEKKAAWKTAQLRHIRKAEELKHLRSLQVEKMKSEMLNLQNQLHNVSTDANCSNPSLESDDLRDRGNSSPDLHRENELRRQDLDINTESIGPFDMNGPLMSNRPESQLVREYWMHRMDSPHGIVEVKDSNGFLDLETRSRYKIRVRKNPLFSAVRLIGKGVSQVQSLGNMAVNNLMNYLKIEHEELESNKDSSEDEVYYEIENQNIGVEPLEPTSSTHSVHEHTVPDTACLRIGIILRYMWSRMRSNNDVVCYFCFILIYLWYFSLLSVVYLAALFLYALCQNTGPSYIFWVIILIYTEVCILLQYLYQIIVQNCEFDFPVNLLQELGFPVKKITSSFVTNNLPFFLVYIFTLLQISITVKDGGWTTAADLSFLKRRNPSYIEDVMCSNCQERLQRLFLPLKNVLKMLIRNICWYWKSLTWGAETPPYFVQLSMEVNSWPKEGIQPTKIESKINKLLTILHDRRCKEENLLNLQSASKVRIQSIEKSEENENLCFVVFEVLYAAPPIEFNAEEWYSSLTPAADVSNEIRKAQDFGIFKEIGFPYRILSVIGGVKREIDLYAYIFGADLAVFFLIAIFYQLVMKANSEFLEVYQLEDQFPEEFVSVLMLEDIHASLYLVKCDVDLNRSNHEQGEKQTKMTKFCNGICLFFVLMCVIWAPMLMYSSGNPTNIANPIKDASARLDINTVSGRLTLFETTLCEKISWEKLVARTSLDPEGYLNAYNEKDIQLICCQPDASTSWLVPPVVQARFTKSLRWDMEIIFSWQFTRDRPKGKELVKYELTIEDRDLPESSEVTEVFNGTSNSFTVFNIYPRYFRVTGSGDVRSLEQSVELVNGDLVLNRGNPEWWSFYDTDISDAHGCGEFPGPMAIIVSEETPQGIIGETLSKFSIWGLYITFVLAVGRFIRLQCSDLRMRIPYENLPSCDRLMAICEDIYAARAEGELEVEEVLFWTLVKIYRSPHMLLEYTQPD